ncbi:hypothetical protein [Rhizobium leguminosarum]|uniref:DUF541 domain-containing protein n=1 Tax=Rhizobium leguminosarum TaxID=384 RepID=A0A7K3VRS3_RHILE|nr:hypothetical protein [Rhizobium leguminosarum]NEK19889.1 hypothetical protein [Rhizobium leguminosarum]
MRYAVRHILCTFKYISLAAFILLPSQSYSDECNFDDIVLSERQSSLRLGTDNTNIYFGGSMSFSREGKLYRIREKLHARLSESVFLQQTRAELEGQLPSDDCGAEAEISSLKSDVRDGILLVNISVSFSYWECEFGIQAEVASGKPNVRLTFTPAVSNSKVKVVVASFQEGSIKSNVPDYDSEITSMVAASLAEAKRQGDTRLATFTSSLQSKIDQHTDELAQSLTAVNQLYQPLLTDVSFGKISGSILIEQTRETKAREGTTCTIKRIAGEQWRK